MAALWAQLECALFWEIDYRASLAQTNPVLLFPREIEGPYPASDIFVFALSFIRREPVLNSRPKESHENS